MARRLDLRLAATVLTIVAASALLGRIGADARWLAALGHAISVRGMVPTGVPFAAASTAHWHNPLVLAELVFGALGERGLVALQLVAVLVALVVLARDAIASDASARGTSIALVLAGLGALPSLAIARAQLFSVALFPLLVALLRAESRQPSRRIWLAPVLLAVWSNVHGVALLGLGLVVVYLVLERRRAAPVLAVASALSLLLTPALAGTVAYYHGVLTNVAAQRGDGMWGPLSLTAPTDLVLIVCTIALAIAVRRARLRPWEVVALVLLGGLTLKAGRNGVWLLMLLVGPAARGIPSRQSRYALAPAVMAVAGIGLAFALIRGPVPTGAGRTLLARAVSLAHGSPVLASGGIDEQVALDGGRVWVGNPIDAFAAPDQAAYLDWIRGRPAGRLALAPDVRVVVVSRGDAAESLMARNPGFALITADRTAELYERLR